MFIDYYFTRLKRFTRASDFCSQHGAMIDRVIVLSCGWLRLALSFQLERRGREILRQTYDAMKVRKFHSFHRVYIKTLKVCIFVNVL